MKLIFLGTAGSLITANKSYPSILIDEVLLLDCGEGTTQKLLKINSIESIETICITHLHNDHFLGLFSLLWYFWLSGRSIDLEIIGPPKTQETIENVLDLINTPKRMRSSFNINFIELKDSNEMQYFNRDYEISSIKVNHSILSYAYRIEKNSKSICYSGDTAPSDNLVKLAKYCDLLIYESTFPNKFKNIAYKYGHSTPYDLARLAIETNSKQVAMVHIASTYLNQIDNFKVEAEKELKRPIIIAEDLMVLEI
jgi:ribonuclease Z